MKKKENHTVKTDREFFYKIIAVCLPFLIIALLELSLRLFSYGDDLGLFTEYEPNKEFLVVNHHASKRYFLDPAFAPTGNRELFKKKKSSNTLRIFVLGESTTVGYPYFHNASFHRWLLFRMMHNYPEKHFEIINLSLTAVNSYTILGFAKELVNYEPDAVLIYTGQNEYYGGLGVASAQSIGGNPSVVNGLLRLRDMRTVQLLLNTFRKESKSANLKLENADMTRMEFMVGDQKIEYKSELYEKGLNQFRHNMDATLRVLSKNNIPVFLGNVVSNVKDIPPFIGENGADEAYRSAQSFWKEGKYEEAADYFMHAKDLDELRFRAPKELNEIIAELCPKYPRVYLVDVMEEMKKRSLCGVLGDELFTDHVHPNLKGYAIMASAFYGAMRASGFLPEATDEMTDMEVYHEMPVSPVDSIAGEFRIMRLKSHWPYNDKRFDKPIPERTIEEKLAASFYRKEESWLDTHNLLYQAYTKTNRLDEAAKVAEGVVLEYSEDPAFYDRASMDYGKNGQIKKAASYMRKSFQLSASFEKARYLFVYYLMMDEPVQALTFLDYAIDNNTGTLKLAPIKPLVQQVIALKRKLTEAPEDIAVMNEIANTYMKMDNRTTALLYVDRVLSVEPQNTVALQIKNQLK